MYEILRVRKKKRVKSQTAIWPLELNFGGAKQKKNSKPVWEVS